MRSNDQEVSNIPRAEVRNGLEVPVCSAEGDLDKTTDRKESEYVRG
jgi:hypothetical protein